MDRPILITGCARSGTSLVAGVVHLCGAFGGDMSGPTRYNPKGMFENSFIRDRIMKPYLKGISADPMGQKPLPEFKNIVPFTVLGDVVTSTMQRQGYKRGPWFYKGAKICLVWTEWDRAFPDALWVIVRRDTEEIVSSCMRTPFMRAYGDREGWESWVTHHLERFHEIRTRMEGRVIEVWTPPIIEGDLRQLESMADWAGLSWSESVVKRFISPELWHG